MALCKRRSSERENYKLKVENLSGRVDILNEVGISLFDKGGEGGEI